MKAYQWMAGVATLGVAAVLVVPVACDSVRVAWVEHREAYVAPAPVAAPPPPAAVVPPPPATLAPPSYVEVPPPPIAPASFRPVAPASVPPAPVAPVAYEIPAPPIVAPADFDVETRGPVHEAFAEPIQNQPQPGILINHAPPDPIQETPPDARPADSQAIWIPGYWSWDDDRNDFVWVSGIWRVPPPDCTWVPGYWVQTNQGYQWVAGYWCIQTVDEVEYLPAPPAPVELGPVGEAPSDDVTWACGYWDWQNNAYLWRPGMWIPARPEWVWTPPHYIWTPRGCIFIPGHWDYALERRGLCFAPVYFPQAGYMQAGFSYQPTVIIDLGPLTACLFARPDYCHYYFGDYYDARYARQGIYPWYEAQTDHRWNDPIYEQERWRHLSKDPQWDAHQKQAFDERVKNPQDRPPRSWQEQQAWSRTHPQAAPGTMVMAEPLKDFIASRRSTVKFETLNQQQRKDIEQKVQAVHQVGVERSKIETAAPPATKPEKLPRPGVTPKPGPLTPEPRKVVEPPTAPEPRKVVEPPTAPEARKTIAPPTAPEPRKVVEPPTAPEPRKIVEPPAPTKEVRTPVEVRTPIEVRTPAPAPIETRGHEERVAQPMAPRQPEAVRSAPPEPVRSAPEPVRSAPPSPPSSPDVRSPEGPGGKSGRN